MSGQSVATVCDRTRPATGLILEVYAERNGANVLFEARAAVQGPASVADPPTNARACPGQRCYGAAS